MFPASLMQSTVAKQEMRLRAGRGRKRAGWDWRSVLGAFPEACLPGRSCTRDPSEALFSAQLLHPVSRSVCLWVLLASSQRGNFLLCLKKKKKKKESKGLSWANSKVPSSSKFICLSNSLIFAKALATATAWRQSLQSLLSGFGGYTKGRIALPSR